VSVVTLNGMSPVLTAVRRGIAPCTALVLAWSVAGCGGTHHATKAAGGSNSSPSTHSSPAKRWWSNSAVPAGSAIDAAHPAAAAAGLHESRHDYCGMLKQTVAAGKSILPGVKADDPVLLTSTKAFVAEIAQVAPGGVHGQWQVLGPVILALVKSGGDTTALKSIDVHAVAQSADAIAADSIKNCGVNLASAVGALHPGK
jgi:hypothetical protein